MIGRAILKTVRRRDLKLLAKLAKPELRRVQQVRAEIRQNARAPVAPSRIADEPRSAVPVEHAATIDRPQRAGSNEVSHPHIMRLKAMVIRRIADDPFGPR